MFLFCSVLCSVPWPPSVVVPVADFDWWLFTLLFIIINFKIFNRLKDFTPMIFSPLNFIFSTPFDGISLREQRTGQNKLTLFLFLFSKMFFILIFHSLNKLIFYWPWREKLWYNNTNGLLLSVKTQTYSVQGDANFLSTRQKAGTDTHLFSFPNQKRIWALQTLQPRNRAQF